LTPIIAVLEPAGTPGACPPGRAIDSALGVCTGYSGLYAWQVETTYLQITRF